MPPAAIPGARLLTVTGLGHHKLVDAPEVIAAGLRFLDGGTHVGEHVQAAGTLKARSPW